MIFDWLFTHHKAAAPSRTIDKDGDFDVHETTTSCSQPQQSRRYHRSIAPCLALRRRSRITLA